MNKLYRSYAHMRLIVLHLWMHHPIPYLNSDFQALSLITEMILCLLLDLVVSKWTIVVTLG